MKIQAGAFKVHCLRLLSAVHDSHKEILITKRGKPMAKLVPVQEESKKPLFGFMKDSVIIKGDIVSPVGEKWFADE